MFELIRNNGQQKGIFYNKEFLGINYYKYYTCLKTDVVEI